MCIRVYHSNGYIQDLKQLLDQKQEEIKKKSIAIAQGNDRIARAELQLKEQKALTEKALKVEDLLHVLITDCVSTTIGL